MDAETLYKAFKIAIEREHEAKEFYEDLASKIADPEIKRIFQQIASEESKHFDYLTELYKSMKEKATQQ